jgi:hypothetical protein
MEYLVAVRDHLRRAEPEVWAFFASAPARAEHAAGLRMELLKATYRLDRESHPELHAALGMAAGRLGIEHEVTLYQAQQPVPEQPNASVISLAGAAHVVFSGGLLDLLSGEERLAVLGHELSHHLLATADDGTLLIADRVLNAAAAAAGAEPGHRETARLFRLHTEVYADRGALVAADDLPSVVSALVKLVTGLRTVSGASYLRQAAEIFADGPGAGSAGVSHPELFLRAHALDLWAQRGTDADGQLVALLRGTPDLDRLDLLDQERLTGLTGRLWAQALRPAWARTETVLAHAHQFLPGLQPAAERDPVLAADVNSMGAAAADYLSFVLLDFATVDPDVGDAALAHALVMSGDLGFGGAFDRLAARELGLRGTQVGKLRAEAPATVAAVSSGDGAEAWPIARVRAAAPASQGNEDGR